MFLCNANVVVTMRLPLIFFAHFNFVLGDDFIGAGVLGATEAAVDAGEVLLNGLIQVPEAGFKAGQALGNAAVDWFSGSQDTTAGSNVVSPATDGSASDAESLAQNPDPAPDTANPTVPVSALTEPQEEGSNHNPDIEIDVTEDPEPSKTGHNDCDSENSKVSLRAWTTSWKIANLYDPPCHRIRRIRIHAVLPQLE